MSYIKLFESKKIRSSWNEEEEKWYFSVIDVIEVLTGSPRPRKYWNALKTKLKDEGSELSHNLGQLKMAARRQNENDRCCRHRTAFPIDTIHSITKGRTF